MANRNGSFTTPNPSARICLWYRDGKMNSEPHTAIVLRDDDDERGVLRLAVVTGGRVFDVRYPVRHANDPYIKKRPDVTLEGVWDYLPTEKRNLPLAGSPPRSAPAADKPRSTKKTNA